MNPNRNMDKIPLDSSKVTTGLDPLSQIRVKKPSGGLQKDNSSQSTASNKKPINIEPKIIEFDFNQYKKTDDMKKSPINQSFFQSPFEDSKIDEKPNITNKTVISTAFKDLKTFGFANDEKMAGEVILETADSSIILNSSMCDGKLILTNYKLHFRPMRTEFYQSYQLRAEFFQMPIMSIEKVGKYPEKKTNYLYLDLQTKDMRVFKFRIPSENFKEGEKVFSLLDSFLTKKKKEHTALDFARYFKNLDLTYKGWEIYDIFREFEREKAEIQNKDGPKTIDNYVLRYFDNSGGQTCSTYPDFIVIPSRVTDEVIYKSSKFRTKERLPVLTYCYRQIINGQIAKTYLWRSSQCKVL